MSPLYQVPASRRRLPSARYRLGPDLPWEIAGAAGLLLAGAGMVGGAPAVGAVCAITALLALKAALIVFGLAVLVMAAHQPRRRR